jgi:hypothetical protein
MVYHFNLSVFVPFLGAEKLFYRQISFLGSADHNFIV